MLVPLECFSPGVELRLTAVNSCKDVTEVIIERKSTTLGRVRKAAQGRKCDSNLSSTLADSDIQNLAHAFWLYEDRRTGMYSKALEAFEERQRC